VKGVRGSPIILVYIYIYIYIILGAPGLEKAEKKGGEERVKIGYSLISFRRD
jgi:hypothetical protein